ncbi:alpha/beta fold hydrolase [Noviherbaspirillum sedimenti]|uniref:Alpha/beta hydrolase n=1 Tax=Noviherbaspirillum sedimenti TaxID=2320865 RepID=A0A3A3G339_9BURK|nr:alpha/beta hydrolase [Noviherbaspirillum sedimenti]RJG01229.1 alpha/beta hydrolase [Noviherbaspirillum sedimenti]
MPVFRYKNSEIYYDLFGNEGDPALTLVNGLSMRTSHWAPYFKMLPQKGVRVLSYDMLGQGHSSKPILGVDFDDHAIMLKALHDHLGIEQPYVMGISFGGVVVLRYAIMFPDALKGLLPISTFSELDPVLTCHAANLYISMARVGFEFYLDLLMPLNFTNEWLSKNRDLLAIVKRVGSSGNEIYGIQNLMESLASFSTITPDLAKITVPTLILNGEYDALTPRHLHDIIRTNTPNSRMLVLPRMSHAFTLEIPELCARIFAEFIAQVGNGTWQGDQTVWIANEDANAPEIAYQCPGDHLRYVPQTSQEPTTQVKRTTWVRRSTRTAKSARKTVKAG